MSITLTMKMTPVLFLLCSGFFHFTFASNRLRFFSLNGSKLYLSDSLSFCNNTGASLVTLYDEEDINFTSSFIESNGIDDKSVWLGLRRNRNITWSDGFPITFNPSSEQPPSRDQQCVAINNGTWKGYNCSDRKPFMCYKGDKYTLIKKEKDWCQARKFCKTHFCDLVSIRNKTQNNRVIENGADTSFWIGLMRDEWQWVDKGCSTFRKWVEGNNTEKPGDDCSVQHIIDNPLAILPCSCGSIASTLCSKGSVRIKVITEKLTWEDAFQYCQENHTGLLSIETHNDQLAVEQWLNTTNVSGPFWIGLRQSRVFGFWIWTNDRTVTYSKWKRQPELPLSNHCGVIETDNYSWTDENCLYPHHFLCEEQIPFMNKNGHSHKEIDLI